MQATRSFSLNDGLYFSWVSILSYEQIPDWQDQAAAGYGAVVAEQKALEAELGAAAAIVLEASITLDLRPYRGNVRALAVRI